MISHLSINWLHGTSFISTYKKGCYDATSLTVITYTICIHVHEHVYTCISTLWKAIIGMALHAGHNKHSVFTCTIKYLMGTELYLAYIMINMNVHGV